ncbi:MAG: hypothetical protein KME49_12830 [Brasilonema octagenarum HA4186-MV1]|uniref:hypothetical protein n=1 Tax=Brasilonema TaxID=383614 RepID=UPI00145DBF00|nr:MULTISPECIES: hypothetical protein [Brasilonema]MBW4626351.1 hypothetical protein [Brasilonema octagenarum HA4186-MV1]
MNKFPVFKLKSFFKDLFFAIAFGDVHALRLYEAIMDASGAFHPALIVVFITNLYL